MIIEKLQCIELDNEFYDNDKLMDYVSSSEIFLIGRHNNVLVYIDKRIDKILIDYILSKNIKLDKNGTWIGIFP